MTQSGHLALLTNVVVDDATGDAGEDRREGGQSRAVRHVSTGRGRGAEKLVPENLGPDR